MIVHLLDVVLVGVVIEAVALVVIYRRTGHGIAPKSLLPTLGAGFFLMVALRLAAPAAAEGPLALCLLLSLAAHLCDLAVRWRRVRPST